jgi:hypothetical protein
VIRSDKISEERDANRVTYRIRAFTSRATETSEDQDTQQRKLNTCFYFKNCFNTEKRNFIRRKTKRSLRHIRKAA